MRCLKSKKNIVVYIFEIAELEAEHISPLHFSAQTPICEELVERTIDLCNIEDDAYEISINVVTDKREKYAFIIIGINDDSLDVVTLASMLPNNLNVEEIPEVEGFDLSIYNIALKQWDVIKDGTTIEIPIPKEAIINQPSETSNPTSIFSFEFRSLKDIESLARAKTITALSDLYQKRDRFVLNINATMSKKEELFLESKIAEFNGVRIPLFFNDVCMIQKKALEALEIL